MKGFTKPKLALAVVVLVVLTSAIAIPLVGKAVGAHAQSPASVQAQISITPTKIFGEFLTNPNGSGAFDVTRRVVFTQTFSHGNRLTGA